MSDLIDSLSRNLRGYWCPMLQYGGLTLRDQTKFKNNGTLTNMDVSTDWVMSRVRGRSGRVLDFNGVTDHVEIADNPNLRITGSITVASWFKRNSAVTNRPIFSKYSSSSQRAWFLATENANPGDGLVFAAQSSATSFNANQQAIYTSDIGNAWNFAIGRLVAGSACELWLNGSLVATAAAVTNSIFASTTPLRIGRLDLTYFPGQVAECAIWNRALSAAEIQTLYRLGPGWYRPQLPRRIPYSEQQAGFRAYWARRQSQLIGGGV